MHSTSAHEAWLRQMHCDGCAARHDEEELTEIDGEFLCDTCAEERKVMPDALNDEAPNTNTN